MIVGRTRLPPTTTTKPSAIDSVRKIPKTLDTHSGVSFSRSDDGAAAAAVVVAIFIVQFIHGSIRECARPFAFQWIIANKCERTCSDRASQQFLFIFFCFLYSPHIVLWVAVPLIIVINCRLASLPFFSSFRVSVRIWRQVLSYGDKLQCNQRPRRA